MEFWSIYVILMTVTELQFESKLGTVSFVVKKLSFLPCLWCEGSFQGNLKASGNLVLNSNVGGECVVSVPLLCECEAVVFHGILGGKAAKHLS